MTYLGCFLSNQKEEKALLEKLFKLKENGTTVSREVIAGIVTFMTMAYIIFVNPDILSKAMGSNLFPAIAVATCLAAGITTIAMGLFTNYPLALASGMGLNGALVALVFTQHVSWKVAMGVIFIEGIIITILVLTNIREWVMNAIPMDLKRAIGVGIGLFIALIGLQGAGLIVDNQFTLIGFGALNAKNLITLFGLILTGVLVARKVKGGILIGIVASTSVALLAGLISWPKEWISAVKPEYFETFFKLDIQGALSLGLVTTIFAFLITDFFDTMGTVVAVGEEAGYVTKEGKVPRLKKVLLVDSLAAVAGGCFRMQLGNHIY